MLRRPCSPRVRKGAYGYGMGVDADILEQSLDQRRDVEEKILWATHLPHKWAPF